jgi:hypothetical protein
MIWCVPILLIAWSIKTQSYPSLHCGIGSDHCLNALALLLNTHFVSLIYLGLPKVARGPRQRFAFSRLLGSPLGCRMSKEVKRQKASSDLCDFAAASDALCQVGFAGSEAVVKEEVDAPLATPEVAMIPTGSNLAPQQYRTLLLKRFSENKDNVLGFLGTYKDRLEGELQFLCALVAPLPPAP